MPIFFYPLTPAGILGAIVALSAFVMLLVLGSQVLPGSMRMSAARFRMIPFLY